MTGRTDSGISTWLVAIVPVAIALAILFAAWPLVLALVGAILLWRLWQQARWRRIETKLMPAFRKLMDEYGGRLTVTDLALEGDLSGYAVQQFLDRKADEYNALRRESEQGVAYYFLTAAALGTMFDAGTSSEAQLSPEEAEDINDPDEDEDEAIAPSAASDEPESALTADSLAGALDFDAETDPDDIEPAPASKSDATEETPATEAPPATLGAALRQRQAAALQKAPELTRSVETPAEKAKDGPDGSALIQAELAKRLDVHPSTVGKRKTDSDFSEWSQCRDPEGIAWVFDNKNKTFSPKT